MTSEGQTAGLANLTLCVQLSRAHELAVVTAPIISAGKWASEPLEAPRPGTNNRDPALRKVQGKDCHSKSSSDLMCVMAHGHTHTRPDLAQLQ